MTPAEVEARARGGRPRDPALDDAILEATVAIFAEDGYAGVSIEGVAARAGVGKASIYRRWSSKVELVVEAIRVCAGIEDDLPDTGDLRADIVAMMQPLSDRLRAEDQLLMTFAAERVRNRELAHEFNRSVIGAKRAHLVHLVQAAVQRGELPAGIDVQLVAELVPALLWHHALNGLELPEDLIDRVLDLVLPR